MNKKDDKNGLSTEDAALWDKVKKTILPQEKAHSPTTKSAKPTLDPNLKPETSDFAKLLDKPKTKKPAQNHQELKASINSSLKTIPNPSRAEFAAMLDNPETSILPPPLSAEANSNPTKPSYSPPKNNQSDGNKISQIEQFNQRDARNISSGKQQIDAAIDLHGLTLRQAETALKTFLKRASADDKRTVLIITGKGQSRDHYERSFELGAPEPGVIRRSVPQWLDDMPNIILSYTTSHSKHGGEGALYVRLRRITNAS